MKKYNSIFKDENGNYVKKVIFADKLEEVKALPNYIGNDGIERVKHPSPEIMVRALYAMGVKVVDFYEMCDEIVNISGDAENNPKITKI